MASEHSFDIVSKVDLQEVDNAVYQSMKEIKTRYDFKGSLSEIKREDQDIIMIAEDQYRLKSVHEILSQKLAKRGVPLKALSLSSIQEARGGTVTQKISLQEGIPTEKAREIVKIIKSTKLKVQPSIMGDQLRVKAKNKDDLQAIMKHLKESHLQIDMQFTNYR